MTMQDDRAGTSALTDAAIASMFDRRARRADGADLSGAILRITAISPQVRRWLALPLPARPRMGRLLLVALLALAVAGVALYAAAALRKASVPKVTAESFVPAFEYAIPAASSLRPAADGPHRDLIAWVEGPDLPLDPSTEPLYGGQRPESGKVRGIIVASAEYAWSHSATGRFVLRTSPAEFVADLRDTANVPMGPVVATALDGRAAVTTVLTGTASNDIHVGGSIMGLASRPFILVNDPGRLIVTEVDGQTVFVLIWARTPQDLEAWMPVADQFVASIHFLPEADP